MIVVVETKIFWPPILGSVTLLSVVNKRRNSVDCNNLLAIWNPKVEWHIYTELHGQQITYRILNISILQFVIVRKG